MNAIGSGLSCLLRGAGWILRRPKLFGLGAIPPLITSVLLIGVVISMFFWVPPLADRLTGFAAGWAPWLDTTVQVVASILLFAGILVVLVVAFSSLTLLLGGPFYERIAAAVETELGGAPAGRAVEIGVGRSIGQSIIVVVLSLLGTVLAFVLGLVPAVGTAAGLVVNALVGGWLIALELVGQPAASRGLGTLRERSAMMKSNRLAVWGFGVPAFWLLAIPFVSVIAFPAAAAGGVLLTRKLHAEPWTLSTASAAAAPSPARPRA
ncbi:EI24 domain-containing protein [Naumannella halotolerans]|uniref:CysZ protein n=1 Tax=Naumannella halotolerans TaxID=993414 RepID=A0A4R7J9C0_9ACTN|nr:EI24 domain-containing protein [Naumannella halotolerans]TDT34111.1 CysZ protein [Naumannella halotolerans]